MKSVLILGLLSIIINTWQLYHVFMKWEGIKTTKTVFDYTHDSLCFPFTECHYNGWYNRNGALSIYHTIMNVPECTDEDWESIVGWCQYYTQSIEGLMGKCILPYILTSINSVFMYRLSRRSAIMGVIYCIIAAAHIIMALCGNIHFAFHSKELLYVYGIFIYMYK
jgi:hypothetical protein